MARVKKTGVDYFSHDCDASNRRTLATLESQFGNDGYAFWFKLLELLGQQKDLYIDFSDELQWMYFVARAHVSEERAEAIMNFLVRLQAVDGELWKKHKVVWVQNFVERLSDVFKKRKQNIPEKPKFGEKITGTDFPENNSSVGISATEIPQNEQQKSSECVALAENAENGFLNSPENNSSAGISAEKSYENNSSVGISATEIPQRKVKKSKVNNNTSSSLRACARGAITAAVNKEKTDASDQHADRVKRCVGYYESVIHPFFNCAEKDAVIRLATAYPEKMVCEAIESTGKQGVHNAHAWKYVAKILENAVLKAQKGSDGGGNDRYGAQGCYGEAQRSPSGKQPEKYGTYL